MVNIAIFDSPNEELLGHFKEAHNVDAVVLTTDKSAVGGTYDGSKFWSIKPYPSWIKNEELNEWEAPVPYPVIEEGSDEIYTWDENTTSWLLLPPSN